MSKQKYYPTYIKYGFIAIEREGESLPQCVVCIKTLSNTAIKSSLLKCHLVTNHSKRKNKMRVVSSDLVKMQRKNA